MKINHLRYLTFLICWTIGLCGTVGKAQSSLYLPTATNWVSAGDLDVAGDQLTVEALIYYTGSSVNIVSKHTDPSNVNYLLRIGSFEITTTSGFAAFGGVAAAGVTISPNRTYHVAATYNGAMLRYYVNGCLTGEMPWTGTMINSDLVTAIGNQSTCQCEQFIGHIDEVRIWNVCRTQAQISANMLNLPAPTTEPGLLAYYKFDGNFINAQGNPVYDGVPVNAPAFQQIPLPYPSTLHESVTSSNPICTGEANGLINVSASGYYTPYEYSLDGTSYTAASTFSNLPAGTYTVYTRPQNNNNCVVSSNVTLTDPTPLTTGFTETDITCNGAANGSATVTPAGGDGPTYDVDWLPGSGSGNIITGLAPGNYSVVVSDTCRASGAELVTNGHFDAGNIGFSTGYNCCAGGPGNYAVDTDPNFYNGGHFGTGYGGGGNYLIADGSTVAGTNIWCQTITVNPNSYYNLSAFVTSNYTIELAQVQFTINGVAVGTVTAPAALYTWDPFATVWFSGASTTANICITNLNVIAGGNDFGIDNISFKSCESCSITTPFTITEPPVITLSSTQNDVSCNGLSDGDATITASGGTGTLSYSWNTTPVQTSATATGLPAGTYLCTVTDANGCTASQPVTITEPPVLTAAIVSQSDVSCAGANDGSITASAAGGAGTLSYLWDSAPAQTTLTAAGLPGGTYTFTVTDQNMCTATATATIAEPLALTATITAQNDVSCFGYADGSATVAANGGTGALDYAWSTSPVQTGTVATGLSGGSYTVIVTDANTCTTTATVTIAEPAVFQLALSSSQDISCFGLADGNIFTSLTGGTGAISYTWTPAVSTNDSATALTAGVYSVTAEDANGCLSSVSVTLSEPAELIVDATASPVSLCLGESTSLGSVISSGTGPFTFDWSNGSSASTQTLSPAATETYALTLTGTNGCTSTDSVTVTVFIPGTVDLGNDTAICQGETLILDAGPGFSSYVWQNASITQTITATMPDMYFVLATDANGCTVSDTMLLTVNPLPIPGLPDTAGICPGFTATFTAVAGMSAYSWNNGANTQAITVSTGGNHHVQVTDANGCSAVDSTWLEIYPVPVLSFIVGPTTGCEPLSVSTQNTSVMNGSTVVWDWEIAGQSSNLFQPAVVIPDDGSYDVSLTATTSDGCIVDTLLSNYITVFPAPIASASATANEYDLFVDYIDVINNSTGGSTYIWSLEGTYLGNMDNVQYPITDSGSYSFHLVVISDKGCMDSTDVTVYVKPGYALYFPNAFTPNNDGSNDVYMPVGYGISEFEMLIYDRWGELVFRTTDLYTGWDGRYNGKAPFSDVYVYKVRIRDLQLNPHYFIGKVTLVH